MSGIYTVPGDTVLFHFPFRTCGNLVIGFSLVAGRVRSVERRHGSSSPLVRYTDLATGREASASQYWIAELLNRPAGLVHRPVNRFAESRHRFRVRRINRSTVEGTIHNLVSFYLSTLPMELNGPLDYERVHQLFDKQTPGLVKRRGGSIVQVHVKPFRTWVRRNPRQFLTPVAVLNARRAARDASFEADYWAWVEQVEEGEFVPGEQEMG